jgi:hypothetical protein
MGWATEMGIAVLGRGIAGTCGSILGPVEHTAKKLE